jgi:hypothetical protein
MAHLPPSRIPVIVGIGEVKDRPPIRRRAWSRWR